MNIQPGWEGLVYGVLIAAGVAFVLSTIAVAFALRAATRVLRPTTEIGIWACIPVAACIVAATVGGYIAIKHLQHPTDHPGEYMTAPTATVSATTYAVNVPTPVVGVAAGPVGDIVLTVRVPSCGMNPNVGTTFSSADTLDIRVSPSVEIPTGIEDPFVFCGFRTQDLSIGPMPSRQGVTLTDGQATFTLGADGTWTPSAG